MGIEAKWICGIYGKPCEYATKNGYCVLTACVKWRNDE